MTDAALRKRFQALREHGPLARPDLPVPRRTPALRQLRRSQVELLPRLTAALVGDGHARRVLAASDPDGHGVIFAEVLTPGRRTATSDASATRSDAMRKESHAQRPNQEPCHRLRRTGPCPHSPLLLEDPRACVRGRGFRRWLPPGSPTGRRRVRVLARRRTARGDSPGGLRPRQGRDRRDGRLARRGRRRARHAGERGPGWLVRGVQGP